MKRRSRGPCHFCSDIVESDDRDAYEQITTWVERPQMHSAVMREYTGKLAHKDCTERENAGIASDQEALL